MSAFIVAPATIDVVVSAIYDHLTRRAWNQLQNGQAVQFGPVLIRNEEDLPQLAKALWVMNHRAVNQRYHESHEPDGYTFKFIEAVEPVFAIKQAQCLLYQCAEGDVPDSDLYKALDSIIGKMCEAFVSSRPAYSAAPWGCAEQHVNRGVVSLYKLATKGRT